MLRRGAIGNHHESTLKFAYALVTGLDHSVTALGTLARSPRLFSEVCEAMGVASEDITRASYERVGKAREDDVVWNGLQVPIGDLQFRKAKTCIACLIEDGYAKADWDHVASQACSRHHVLLSDACPCCGSAFTHLRDPLSSCGCDPRRMVVAQEGCSPRAATLVQRVVQEASQLGARLLGKLSATFRWWKGLGIKLAGGSEAEALADLYEGQWPPVETPPQGVEGDRLHPRVVLAPLLESEDVVGHAEGLLARSAPSFTGKLEARTWPASTAMAVLDVGRVPYEKLVAAGHLALDHRNRVLVASVNNLLHLMSPSEGEPVVRDAWVRFRAGDARQSLATVLSALKADDALGHGLDGKAHVEHLISRSMGARENGGMVTLASAASRLRANVESIRGAIRVGLLEGSKGSARSGVQWVIEPGGLEAFDRSYVFASALAAELRGARTTFSSRLRSAGLVPVSGPGIDQGVTFVFRRSDVDKLDLQRVLSDPYQSPAGRKKKGAQCANPRAASKKVSGSDASGSNTAGSVDLESVRRDTGQSAAEFQRAWITTGFVTVHRTGRSRRISACDADRIRALWAECGTATDIARVLGRKRWLCANLQKMGQLAPARIIGAGTRSVRLYLRAPPRLDHYVRN